MLLLALVEQKKVKVLGGFFITEMGLDFRYYTPNPNWVSPQQVFKVQRYNEQTDLWGSHVTYSLNPSPSDLLSLLSPLPPSQSLCSAINPLQKKNTLSLKHNFSTLFFSCCYSVCQEWFPTIDTTFFFTSLKMLLKIHLLTLHESYGSPLHFSSSVVFKPAGRTMPPFMFYSTAEVVMIMMKDDGEATSWLFTHPVGMPDIQVLSVKCTQGIFFSCNRDQKLETLCYKSVFPQSSAPIMFSNALENKWQIICDFHFIYMSHTEHLFLVYTCTFIGFLFLLLHLCNLWL